MSKKKTVTARVARSEPELQNLPPSSELGLEALQAARAELERTLRSMNFEELELRVLSRMVPAVTAEPPAAGLPDIG